LTTLFAGAGKASLVDEEGLLLFKQFQKYRRKKPFFRPYLQALFPKSKKGPISSPPKTGISHVQSTFLVARTLKHTYKNV
jgi:hypothetical protein